MAKQYLYRVDILNRKNSHPLESICYFSGENQFDMLESKNYQSNTTDDVIWNNIYVPLKDKNPDLFVHLPEYLKFRSQKKDMISNARNILWKNVFERETRKDAQFARLFELSIPGFFSQKEAVELLSDFANILVSNGIIADASIHSKQRGLVVSLFDKMKMANNGIKVEEEQKNTNFDYRAFLMCTLRGYENGRFVNKNREWNTREQLEGWRWNWVELLANKINTLEIEKSLRDSWEEKLSIYSEYSSIKKKLLSPNKIGI